MTTWREDGSSGDGSVKMDLAMAAVTQGPDGSGDGLWEDGSNDGGSVKMDLAAATAGRSRRRGR
jgi:hypothetical protein